MGFLDTYIMKLYNEKDVAAIRRRVEAGEYRGETLESCAGILTNGALYVKGVKITYALGTNPTLLLREDVTSDYLQYWRSAAVGRFVRRDIRLEPKVGGASPYKYLYVTIGADTYKVIVRELFELQTLSREIVQKKKSDEPISEYDRFMTDYNDIEVDGVPHAIIKIMFDGEGNDAQSVFDEYHTASEAQRRSDEEPDAVDGDDEPMCDRRDDEYDESLNVNLFDE